MTPEEVGQWLQAHGGPAGGEGPDVNGRIVQRAADGSYIVQQMAPGGAMTVVATREAGSAGETPVTSPAAPAPPPGSGGMNQQQIEELLRQVAPNNDPVNRLVFTEGVRKKSAPADDFGGGGETQTRWVKWTDPATGRTIEADVEPDGTYTVTFNGTKKENQGAAIKPEEQQAGTKEGDTRGPQNGPTREVYEGGKWVVKPNPLYQTPESAKPKPEQRNGQWGYWDTSKTPPVWTAIQNGPGAELKPVEINGQWGVWEPGAGGVPTFKPVAVPQAGTSLKNVEPFTPDYGQPDLGLGAWAARQRGKIGLPPEQGGISQKDYDSAVTSAHASATTTITNVTGATNVRRQAEQDERDQRQTLSKQAADDYANASTELGTILKNTTPTASQIGSVIPAIMAEQARYRQQAESRARPAPPLHPMFQWTQGAPGAPTTPPAPSGPTPPNAIGLGGPGAMPTPGGTPPRVQAGAAPAVSAPAMAAPPAAPVAPAPQPVTVGQNPDAGQALGPTGNSGPLPTPGVNPDAGQALGPTGDSGPLPPPVDTSSWPQYAPLPDPTMGPDPGQTVMPPSPAPAPAPTPTPIDPAQAGPPPLIPQMQQSTPEIIDPYQPGMPGDDMMQRTMAPGPVSAWAQNALGKPAPAPGKPAPAPVVPGQPVLPNLQQQMPAAFDPFPTAGKLAQWGLPADAVAQAMAELGMIPQEQRA